MKEELAVQDGSDMEAANETTASSAPRSREEIARWLSEYLAFLLEEKPEAIDVQRSFDRYGIDSATAVSLIADLEDWMKLELDPTLVYEYPTIDELSTALDGLQDGAMA
jgi:acyl carrier protein